MIVRPLNNHNKNRLLFQSKMRDDSDLRTTLDNSPGTDRSWDVMPSFQIRCERIYAESIVMSKG